jgi:hypothetical protein
MEAIRRLQGRTSEVSVRDKFNQTEEIFVKQPPPTPEPSIPSPKPPKPKADFPTPTPKQSKPKADFPTPTPKQSKPKADFPTPTPKPPKPKQDIPISTPTEDSIPPNTKVYAVWFDDDALAYAVNNICILN